MNIEANAVIRAFLNDAYSVFMQRDLWLFVESKPASASEKLDEAPKQQVQPADLDKQLQTKSSRDLLGILRPPATLNSKMAAKPDLLAALKTLSASATLNGLQTGQANIAATRANTLLTQRNMMASGQQEAESSEQYASGHKAVGSTQRQAFGSDMRQTIQARTLQDAKLNSGSETGQSLKDRSVPKAISDSPTAIGKTAEYVDENLVSIMRNRALLMGLLSEIVANSDSPSQPEGEFELPVILNAGMIPGGALAKPPLRLYGPAPMSNEQMLAALLQLGVEPGLLEKLKRILAKLKGSKKLAKSFLSVFVALFIVAERIVEELTLFMEEEEEEEEIKEKIAYADTHGFNNDRRRVYI